MKKTEAISFLITLLSLWDYSLSGRERSCRAITIHDSKRKVHHYMKVGNEPISLFAWDYSLSGHEKSCRTSFAITNFLLSLSLSGFYLKLLPRNDVSIYIIHLIKNKMK